MTVMTKLPTTLPSSTKGELGTTTRAAAPIGTPLHRPDG